MQAKVVAVAAPVVSVVFHVLEVASQYAQAYLADPPVERTTLTKLPAPKVVAVTGETAPLLYIVND